jgi:iron(III) transport system substrate-binding protein
MKRVVIALCACLVIALVLACGKKDAANSRLPTVTVTEWAKTNKLLDGTETATQLYEQAKKEGKVVVYSVSSRISAVKKSFEEAYPGIIVEGHDLHPNDLIEKISREYEAGVRNADLLLLKDESGSIYQEFVLPGIFINYFPSDIVAHIDPKFRKYAMPMNIEILQWFYNKETNSEPPITSWWDLTKPEWKGRIAMLNPLDNIGYLAILTTIVQHADEMAADYERVFGKKIELSKECPNAGYEFIKRLKANDIIFFGSNDEVCEAAGAPGQKPPTPVGYAASSKLRKNETDGWVMVPANVRPANSLTNTNNLYIVNEAQHPAAAKLLLRFMMGESDGKAAGYTPFNVLGAWPVRDDMQPVKGSQELSGIYLWEADPVFLYENIPLVQDFWTMLL